jgi:hypothetical protein
MVQLDVVGWFALLAPASTAGAFLAHCSGRGRVNGAVSGAGVAWLMGVVVDSLRWRRCAVSFNCPDVPVEELERLVERLHADGIGVVLELDNAQSAGDGGWRLRTTTRHRNAVGHRVATV